MDKTEKDFNAKMNNSKDLPKITEIKDEAGIKKWGGKTLVIAPPLDYDALMKLVPIGKVTTTNELRKALSKKYNVEVCCPLTAGIFTNICAWASSQRTDNITPFWRTLKSGGELNDKYPGGIEFQKEKLESEGFTIVSLKGKQPKYIVKDYENFVKKF